MKSICKQFLYMLLALSCVMCGSDAEDTADTERGGFGWDGGIYDFSFEVVDKTTGADLLDPAVEENILGQPIRIVYDGETYDRVTVDDLQYNPSCEPASVSSDTRTVLALPLALRWGFNDDAGCYQLRFGEWNSGSVKIDEIRFTIDWGDGTRNEIEVGKRKEQIDGIQWTIYQAVVDGRAMPYLKVRVER